jgi:aconitate hydratase
MAPEYGATMGFFPIDSETIDFLRRTGRDESVVQLVERYTKEQGLFRTDATPDPEFIDIITLDLATVVPSLAGPKRPQDRIPLPDVKKVFATSLTTPPGPKGFGLSPEALAKKGRYKDDKGGSLEMAHGDVAIAAITSCTNTSNPSVMIGAGLVAKKAVERGLTVKPFVKTSLAPGSKVVTDYLEASGLLPYLDQLGFNVVGYGCTTCIGNSGPLNEPVVKAIKEGNLIAAGVLSGNRNFEGRIHPNVQANFLASPPLVVAYALAGTVDIDLTKDPIGKDKAGKPVYLKEIWPTSKEIQDAVGRFLTPAMFKKEYTGIETSNEDWNRIKIPAGSIYEWNTESTYIQEPPYFEHLTRETPTIAPIHGARVLGIWGDSTTTDHISPAGDIKGDGPAGKYLAERGVERADFNSFGSRRGNHQVMMRGTFANIRIKNKLLPGTEGGITKHFPTGETLSIYDASMRYQAAGTPLILFAGKDYGMGSSRDWAAKGTILLGVKAVIAESFERIHRSNLIGMGVLPLQFKNGETYASHGLDGTEIFDVPVTDEVKPRQDLVVTATKADGAKVSFKTTCRLDTPVEVDYYRNGGILHYVLRGFLNRATVGV